MVCAGLQVRRRARKTHRFTELQDLADHELLPPEEACGRLIASRRNAEAGLGDSVKAGDLGHRQISWDKITPQKVIGTGT